jgi:hypothetical protein
MRGYQMFAVIGPFVGVVALLGATWSGDKAGQPGGVRPTRVLTVFQSSHNTDADQALAVGATARVRTCYGAQGT